MKVIEPSRGDISGRVIGFHSHGCSGIGFNFVDVDLFLQHQVVREIINFPISLFFFSLGCEDVFMVPSPELSSCWPHVLGPWRSLSEKCPP